MENLYKYISASNYIVLYFTIVHFSFNPHKLDEE